MSGPISRLLHMTLLVCLASPLPALCQTGQPQAPADLKQLFETDPASAFERAMKVFEERKTAADLSGMIAVISVVEWPTARLWYDRPLRDMLAVAIPLAQQRGEWRQLGDLYMAGCRGEPVFFWRGHARRTLRYLRLAEEAYARAGCTAAGLATEIGSWRQHLQAVIAKEDSWREGAFPPELSRRLKDMMVAAGEGRDVVEYELVGLPAAEPIYRLATTMVQPQEATAQELAALYHERWEIETAWDELKTHLRGSHIVLRSKTPELVKQEVWGLLMAHFAVRGIMHEAALQADEDPDKLSFTHAVRVIRRKLPGFVAVPPAAAGPTA
jgi:hypothetical protein